jgi:hypothetical protein
VKREQQEDPLGERLFIGIRVKGRFTLHPSLFTLHAFRVTSAH